jgi:hypothetical protein
MTAVQTTNYCEKNVPLKKDADYIKVVFQFTVYVLNEMLLSNEKQDKSSISYIQPVYLFVQ